MIFGLYYYYHQASGRKQTIFSHLGSLDKSNTENLLVQNFTLKKTITISISCKIHCTNNQHSSSVDFLFLSFAISVLNYKINTHNVIIIFISCFDTTNQFFTPKMPQCGCFVALHTCATSFVFTQWVANLKIRRFDGFGSNL